MSTDPDRIRADIERTRSELSSDVDALTDKVSPSRVAERQTDKLKSAVSGVKDKVLGVADDARSTTSDAAHAAADAVGGAPSTARSSASGNPLAAGLIAFGVGLLAASLIPSSRKEQELLEQAKSSDAVQGAAEQAKSLAQEMAGDLKEPAMEAMDAVKSTATEGAEQVRETATDGAAEVRSSGQHAAEDVSEQVGQSRDRLQGS